MALLYYTLFRFHLFFFLLISRFYLILRFSLSFFGFVLLHLDFGRRILLIWRKVGGGLALRLSTVGNLFSRYLFFIVLVFVVDFFPAASK